MTKLAGFNTQSSEDIPIENDERYLQNFAIQMLSQRVFKGVYSERRWFEPLKEYRDIVVVNSGETELIKDLCIVKKKLREFYGSEMWIGITDPKCVGAPAGYCLFLRTWNKPLGEHEFLIKKVKFTENEICLSVKSKRFIDVNPSAPNLNTSTPMSNNRSDEFIPHVDQDEYFDFTNIYKNCTNLLNNAYNLCTFHNLTTVLSFLLVLTVSLLKFSTEAVKWLGEFTIRFMRESSNILRAIMPLLLALVELIQKTIGGFYLLLAMMWRTWTGGNNHQPLPGNPPTYCVYPPRNYPPISRRPMPPGQMNYRGFYGQRR